MAKTEKTKEKLIYIEKILEEKTDDEHPLGIEDIVRELKSGYGIDCERKSVGKDLFALEACDVAIKVEGSDGRSRGYYYNRSFEIPEIVTIASAVISSKFLTADKTQSLLKKLRKLVSTHQSKELTSLAGSGRIKLQNKSVYINIYNIYEAIANNKKIRFEYYTYNLDKELVPRYKDRPVIVASPYELVWNQDNYYIISINEKCEIRNYRVDRMKDVHMLGDEPRTKLKDCLEYTPDFSIDNYINRSFNMFGGTDERVEIQFDNCLINLAIEKFGSDINIVKVDDNSFKISAIVKLGRGFISWVLQFGSLVKVLGPSKVQQQIKDEIAKISCLYE